ncbi:MAG: pseudaminic acid biosynthesis-associated methylase [Pseudomonadota bacterium]
MTQHYPTEQENFWAGEFGEAYIDRNQGASLLAGKLAFFAKALSKAHPARSFLELGSNIGLNLQALGLLFPSARRTAVEINPAAAATIRAEQPGIEVCEESLLAFRRDEQWDLGFTSGVLIHIDPASLPQAYEALYRHSRRYILIAEYYNATPVEIEYRGHQGKLFKRDFAREMLDAYPDLRLLDYGFVWRHDPNFPLGDITWFLLEKAA